MYSRIHGSLATPFNRRVAVVYDTTASGRFLLKWSSDMVLDPADNVFVVRAVPKVGLPGRNSAGVVGSSRSIYAMHLVSSELFWAASTTAVMHVIVVSQLQAT